MNPFEKQEAVEKLLAQKAELENKLFELCPESELCFVCACCGEGQFEFLAAGQLTVNCRDCGTERTRNFD